MFSASAIFKLVFLSVVPSIGTSLGIVGGRRSAFYPFFVRIESSDPTDLCGGTIVATDIIVTAAHCFHYQDEERWASPDEVYVLKSDFTQRGWRDFAQVYSIDLYVIHDAYDPMGDFGTGPYDIAVVKLSKKIDLNNPENAILEPCLDPEEYLKGFALGMGLINRHPKIVPSVLMEVMVFRDWKCGEYSDHGKEIDNERQICYGAHRNIGTCDGDSGGPLVFQDYHNGKPICFIGVGSFGSTICGDPKFPTVYASAVYFRDWIIKQVLELSQLQWKIKSSYSSSSIFSYPSSQDFFRK